MNLLVTGVAGFIGSRTAEMLLEAGKSVVGVDSLNDYYDVRLKMHRLDSLKAYDNFVFYQEDIEDIRAIDSIFSRHKIEAVLNLAARAGVRYSIRNPQVYVSTNVLGTANLLEMMRKHTVKKMVLASTSSLYAGQAMPFKEDLPVNTPISPYAASKKAAEVLAYSYHYLFDIDVTVLRYFTVYGPAGRPDMSIFRFVRWIDEGKELILYGDGSQSRDFTYVDDVAEGTIKSVGLRGFEIINLGGNEPHSLLEAISVIENALGKKAVVKNMPFPRTDVQATWADISRARALLSWRPKVSLAGGLRATVDWYQENRTWVKDIQIDTEI
jgi:nucleoside-diphosphate-sugar epimerase